MGRGISIPVGGNSQGASITKNGTRSVPTAFIDLEQTIFPDCSTCPSLTLPARKENANKQN